jgi:hypothetical protein
MARGHAKIINGVSIGILENLGVIESGIGSRLRLSFGRIKREIAFDVIVFVWNDILVEGNIKTGGIRSPCFNEKFAFFSNLVFGAKLIIGRGKSIKIVGGANADRCGISPC